MNQVIIKIMVSCHVVEITNFSNSYSSQHVLIWFINNVIVELNGDR